jgi:hypothetical protein
MKKFLVRFDEREESLVCDDDLSNFAFVDENREYWETTNSREDEVLHNAKELILQANEGKADLADTWIDVVIE